MHLGPGDRLTIPMSEKPPYRVPSMDEIRALEPNGIKVISTFSGGGGSSLGYRMAGCTVIGASEFVPAAYEVYRLNASPSTVIWTDDIREMSGVDMLRDVGLAVGELDILDGSPPCAAFSTAGKRSEGWGKVKKYSDTAQRVDDLFYEFARLLEEMKPRSFVAENVEGLVKGVSKGYFMAIHARLVKCGYDVRAAVLDASRLGVPQARKRVIFIGMRNDLGMSPKHPEPLTYVYTMRDALPWLSDELVVTVPKWGGPKSGESTIDRPVFTITAGGVSNTTPDRFLLASDRALSDDLRDAETGEDLSRVAAIISDRYPHKVARKLSIAELRRLCSYPDDYQLLGNYAQRWERLGRSVPPVMMKHIAENVARTLCAV